eukprot:TRINITY_DN24459_c0_g1_i1.p2 TRINITY_DN24459_c0_g1~~TRINITY_DN24459_c0_g1_i1.p2  ORF type:complete len:209 (+),score=19.95 TRINITY_DN24459_c0_g1_i1:253-879(+)
MKASVSYGSLANGLDDCELRKLRNAVLSSEKPWYQDMSHTRQLAVKGDPCWKEALGPARAWALLVSHAQVQPNTAQRGLPNLLELSHWHHCCPRTAINQSWNNSFGPAGRSQLAPRRIGWVSAGPFEWRDQFGRTIHLGRISPRMIDEFMSEAMVQRHEEAAQMTCALALAAQLFVESPLRTLGPSEDRSTWRGLLHAKASCAMTHLR